MPATVSSHADATRAAVPSTNIATCRWRALETQKSPSVRLINDPFASMLCDGEPDTLCERTELNDRLDFFVDLLAVRTRWLDDAIESASPKQIVMLGAGLDTRGWRMDSLRDVPLFEVDFSEVLQSKLKILSSHAPYADVQPVAADLSSDDFEDVLVACGFDSNCESVWVLEGFVGYFTAPELDRLFVKIRRLSKRGSRLVATFTGRDSNCTSMHRMTWNSEADVNLFLQQRGWTGKAVHAALVAQEYGRGSLFPPGWGYYFTNALLL